jgi:hypothetical protein
MDAVAGVEVGSFPNLTVCYDWAMRWFLWNLNRAEILGVLFALALISCVLAILAFLPHFQQRKVNFGFGPDWDCVAQPQSEPVCIKKLGR